MELDGLIAEMPLKLMDAALLIADIRGHFQRADDTFDIAFIDHAVSLAAWAHLGAYRGKSARYIEHPLRNAARFLRATNHGLGLAARHDLAIANILHDTVEDAADAIAAGLGFDGEPREALLLYYFETYGSAVADIVSGMTNEPSSARVLSADAKNEAYRAHVFEACVDPRVAVCKVMDLFDNALSLHHTTTGPDDVRTGRLARKYLPLLPYFRSRLQDADIRAILSPDSIANLCDSLTGGQRRLETFALRTAVRTYSSTQV